MDAASTQSLERFFFNPRKRVLLKPGCCSSILEDVFHFGTDMSLGLLAELLERQLWIRTPGLGDNISVGTPFLEIK